MAMTFTVKRPTPGKSYQSRSVSRSLWDALPFDVEVSGPEPRTDYAAACRCKTVYRITEDGVTWLRKRGLLRREVDEQIREHGKLPTLCRCCGTVE